MFARILGWLTRRREEPREHSADDETPQVGQEPKPESTPQPEPEVVPKEPSPEEEAHDRMLKRRAELRDRPPRDDKGEHEEIQ
jgi:hypothetical protein